VNEASARRGFEEALRSANVPGGALAWTTPKGGRRTLAAGLASLAPPSPASPETWFHLFSGTKLYTAAAVMLLVQDSLLDLDSSVPELLPDLSFRYPVTVRQLLAHNSGLRDTLRAVLAVHPADGTTVPTAEALQRFRLDRGRKPGHGAQYRNVNYAILGELISRVSEKTYPSFVEESLLRPLGTDLRFAQTAEIVARMATGYAGRLSPMRFALKLIDPNTASWVFGRPRGRLVTVQPYDLDTVAVGGLVGRAASFLPLLEEMLRPSDNVLSTESKRMMLSVQALGAAGVISRAGVGLGWKRGVVGATEFWNHEGGGAGFCTETRIYPEAGLGLVGLLNRSQSFSLSRLCHRICERMRQGTFS